MAPLTLIRTPMRTLIPVLAAALAGAPLASLAGQTPDTAKALPDLVVTATRTPVTAASATSLVTVIDRAALDLHQQSSADQALRTLPGANIVGDGAFGTEVRVNLRGLNSGFSTQRTLILLDGRPLTDEYLGHTDLVQYPLEAIDRIEVVQGGVSAAYGTGALGGVINLIPRRGTARPTTTVSALGGSHESVQGSVTHARRFGAVDLLAWGGGSTTNGYRRNALGDQVDWHAQHGGLNLGWDGTGVALRTLTTLFHGKGTDDQFGRRVTRVAEDVSLRVTGGMPAGSELNARVYLNHLDQTLAWFGAPNVKYRQTGIGGSLAQTLSVGHGHRLLAGIDARHNAAEVTEFAGLVNRTETIAAVFLQDEVQLEKVNLLFGLRGDRGGQGETSLSYRAGVRVALSDATSVRASVARAFRAPTLSDRYLPPTPFGPVTFVGNPDLQPETAIGGELGLSQRLGSRAHLDITGFAMRSKDFWDFIADTGAVFKARNITTVPIYGVEARLEANLLPSLRGSLGYAFNDACYSRFIGNPAVEGNLVDDNVKHSGSASLEWNSPRGHAVWSTLQLVGTRYTDPENSAAGKLGGYSLLSGGISIQVAAPVAMRLKGENLLDRKYRTRPEFRQAGRLLYGGFQATF